VKKNVCWLIALVLVAAWPAAAGEAESGRPTVAQDGEKKVEEVTEKKVEKRVVVVPGTAGAAGTAVVRLRPRVEVRVIDGEGGEARGRHFVWRDEGGEVHGFGGKPGEVFFAPGAERGYLGVQLTDLTPELRTHFAAGEDAGVLVAQVVADSPAERAGLRVGDVLTHLDGEPIVSSFDVTARVGGRDAGDVVRLDVVRDRRLEILSATLEKRERAQIAAGALLRRLGEEGGGAFSYEFDPGALHETMEGMETYFASPEWKTQVMQIEGIEGDLRERLEKIEVELQQLQNQLEVDVRIELEDDGNDEGEGDDG